MPTDGTLLLEHMPRGKQYLVTALSVFFSLVMPVCRETVTMFGFPCRHILMTFAHVARYSCEVWHDTTCRVFNSQTKNAQD